MTTTAPATITLSPAQLTQYREEGYTLVRGLIPTAAMAAVKAELLRIEEGDHPYPPEHFQTLDPSKVRNAKGGPIGAGVQLPSKLSPSFKAVADHANLQSAMAQLLGGPVKRFTDQCGIKTRHIKTDQGGRSYFHQDSYYWKIAPELGCNCWIPADAVGKDAIALAVMPGSQKGWKLLEHEQYYDDPPFFGGRATEPFKRLRIPLDKIDFSKEKLVPMQPGDGLFFTNYTWHRSEPNRSGQTLCFYAIAYQRDLGTAPK
ncbi:MAG: phytanoyl-CoA dioxygenase family protein [Planctomycetota bacterium]|nr:phytanoyl-CoA dioxygenase family protein [Planctomycetota bacterium]